MICSSTTDEINALAVERMIADNASALDEFDDEFVACSEGVESIIPNAMGEADAKVLFG